MEAAVARIKDPGPVVDRDPFWRRLLKSLRVRVSGGVPPKKIEVTGGAEF